jgi:hypothetical protein
VPPNGGGNRRLSERGVAAALRRMDEAGERSRRNVVAYLNIGLVPKAPQSFERYEACEGARSHDPARSARTHQQR